MQIDQWRKDRSLRCTLTTRGQSPLIVNRSHRADGWQAQWPAFEAVLRMSNCGLSCLSLDISRGLQTTKGHRLG